MASASVACPLLARIIRSGVLRRSFPMRSPHFPGSVDKLHISAASCTTDAKTQPVADNVGHVVASALKELQSVQVNTPGDGAEHIDRNLRLCAFSPGLNAGERLILLENCLQLAKTRNLDLTIKQHNLVLQTYVVANKHFSSAEYLSILEEIELPPNAETYQLCVLGECSAKNLSTALMLIGEMKRKDFEIKELVFAALITEYCRGRQFSGAFETMQILRDSHGESVTNSTYLTLLRGVVLYGGRLHVEIAVKLTEMHCKGSLDTRMFREVVASVRDGGSLQALLSYWDRFGGPVTDLLEILDDFLRAKALTCSGVLLQYILSAPQSKHVSSMYHPLHVFVRQLCKQGFRVRDEFSYINIALDLAPQGDVPKIHLLTMMNMGEKTLKIMARVSAYHSIGIPLNFDLAGAIVHGASKEKEKAVVVLVDWIQAFQHFQLTVPDRLWYCLVYVAADTGMPVSTVAKLMSQVKLDTVTVPSILQAISSCCVSLPARLPYLQQLANVVSGAASLSPAQPPALASGEDRDNLESMSSPDVEHHISQLPSAVDQSLVTGSSEEEECEDAIGVKRVLSQLTSLVPSSTAEAAGFLESSLPKLMLKNIQHAYLLATYICDERPTVALEVPAHCWYSLQAALHDSRLPLHFFRYSLSLRNAGIPPPVNWLALSLPMHVLIKNSASVDEIFEELVSQVSGNISNLPKHLVVAVFQHWLSVGRPTTVINHFPKVTGPAADDGDLVRLVITAYNDLGDDENARFLLNKIACRASKPAGASQSAKTREDTQSSILLDGSNGDGSSRKEADAAQPDDTRLPEAGGKEGQMQESLGQSAAALGL